MELSPRRHIISSLNPTYISNPILHAEAGYSSNDTTAIAEGQTWEISHPEMALLRRGIQDSDDFGQWEKQKTGMQSVNMHSSGGWIMPLERCLGMRHRGSSTSTPLSSLEKRPTLPLRPWCA
jgi:hypothetical protein